MKTKEEITKEFMTELNALLLKYKAEITVDENISGYYSDPRLLLDIEGIYADGDCIQEYISCLDIGYRLDGKNEIR